MITLFKKLVMLEMHQGFRSIFHHTLMVEPGAIVNKREEILVVIPTSLRRTKYVGMN